MRHFPPRFILMGVGPCDRWVHTKGFPRPVFYPSTAVPTCCCVWHKVGGPFLLRFRTPREDWFLTFARDYQPYSHGAHTCYRCHYHAIAHPIFTESPHAPPRHLFLCPQRLVIGTGNFGYTPLCIFSLGVETLVPPSLSAAPIRVSHTCTQHIMASIREFTERHQSTQTPPSFVSSHLSILVPLPRRSGMIEQADHRTGVKRPALDGSPSLLLLSIPDHTATKRTNITAVATSKLPYKPPYVWLKKCHFCFRRDVLARRSSTVETAPQTVHLRMNWAFDGAFFHATVQG